GWAGAARRADRPAGRGPHPDQLRARRRRNGQRDSGPGAVSGLSRPDAEETSTMSEPDFTVDIYQNEYLPEGGRDVNAVTPGATAGTASRAPAPGSSSAEIIIVDCSGSMNAPPSKIAEARAATAAAVDVIRDGVAFAVIAGTHQAKAIFPPDESLAVAGPQTRESANPALPPPPPARR